MISGVADSARAGAEFGRRLSRRRLAVWSGWGYVALCTVLAGLAFFPTRPSDWPFWALVLATLPGSIYAYHIHYFSALLISSTENESAVARITYFGMWVGLATVQMLLVRVWLRRALTYLARL